MGALSLQQAASLGVAFVAGASVYRLIQRMLLQAESLRASERRAKAEAFQEQRANAVESNTKVQWSRSEAKLPGM